MKSRSYYLVNSITVYRMLAAPVLIYLAIAHQFNIFKWLLAVSFLTDAIDGYLARRFKITSAFGALIDSIADDLTILTAIIGIFLLNFPFILSHAIAISILLAIYLAQNITAFIKYGRITSFHTYSAKFAAVMQGAFILTFFFISPPVIWLFYIALVSTAANLLEEIILILHLPQHRTDVKGWYWLRNEERSKRQR